MKIDRLDWQINVYGVNTVTATMNCADFEQSVRFVELLKNFIFEERDSEEASHPSKAAAGEHEAPEQGQVQGQPQPAIWSNGEHLEQTDTGSVT